MITISDSKKNKIDAINYTLLVELRGLSTDTKPTKVSNIDICNGSVFIEVDTGDIYLFDGASKEWNEVE